MPPLDSTPRYGVEPLGKVSHSAVRRAAASPPLWVAQIVLVTAALKAAS